MNNDKLPQETESRATQHWAAIKRRLAEMESRLVAEFEPAPAEVEQRLRQRAEKLARPEPPMEAGSTLDLQLFELSQETYGIETRYVDEVVPLRQLASIPCTPDHILGIVNVRGRMVSVLDLRRFFELPFKGLSDLNSVMVIADKHMEFGLLTDRIQGSSVFPECKVLEPPAHLQGIRADYLLGVTADQRILLDGQRLLTDPHLVVEDRL
ncbi:chemotaxis protein CheW [Marinobacter sp. SS21]|uniref:chemotaxis protein CheW n=1 Tax=Marinobacter sp. SS21 TaxID=2979460 RepID=UPI00232CEA91|nr:chemotaxis protein CheW [Marinobacter sp. SS21]MDC0663416.1 chemotaxis protein CheW [Marinobacter sp. SS21]